MDTKTLTPAQNAALQAAALQTLVNDFVGGSDPGDCPLDYVSLHVFNYAVRTSGVVDLFLYINDPHNGCPNFHLGYVYPSGKFYSGQGDDLYGCYKYDTVDFDVTYTAADFAV